MKTENDFYATDQGIEWKNKLAADLNTVLLRVEWTTDCAGDDDGEDEAGGNGFKDDLEFSEAAIRLVERVAKFEGIAIVPRSEMEDK